MSGEGQPGMERSSSALGTLGAWTREIAIVVVGALIASTLLRVFVAQMFVIPSSSMENTLMIGDRVAVQKLVPYQRGDIVVFRDSLGWLGAPPPEEDLWQKVLIFVGLAPDESSNHLIKRVIGIAGDHVTCCDAKGRVSVNGTAVNETSYLYVDPVTGRQVDPSSMSFDVVVPADSVFVMGDHRNSSQDSRCHIGEKIIGRPEGYQAMVPTSDIVGTAVAVVYPFDRFHTISRPTSFERVPAPGIPPAKPVIKGDRVIC
ncbi:MAG TPA: signal peptidase I [Propionicimonas sp.]|nr:signal peptidase I [Propionicimonas sp.]